MSSPRGHTGGAGRRSLMEDSCRKSLLQRIHLFESGRVSSVMVRRWDGDENLANVDIHSRVVYLERMLSEGRISRIQYEEQMKTLEERKKMHGHEEKTSSSRENKNGVENNECCGDGEIGVEDGSEVDEDLKSGAEEQSQACSIDGDGSDVSDCEYQRTLGKVPMPELPAGVCFGLRRCGGYLAREESKTGGDEESSDIRTDPTKYIETSNREDHEMKRLKHSETVSDAFNTQDGDGRGSGTSEYLEPSIPSRENPRDCNPEHERSCENVTKEDLVTPPADQPVQQVYSKGTENHSIDDEGQNDSTTCADSSLGSTCTVVTEPSSDGTVLSCDDDTHPGIAALARCSGAEQTVNNIDTQKCYDNLICVNTTPEPMGNESGRYENVLDCDEKTHTSTSTAMSHCGTQEVNIASVPEEQSSCEAHCKNDVAHMGLNQEAAGAADSMHEDCDSTLSCAEHASIGSATGTSSNEIEQNIKIVEGNHERDCKMCVDDVPACMAAGEGVSNRVATECGSYEIALDLDEISTKSTIISTDHLSVEENNIQRETRKIDDGELCPSNNVIDANGQSEAAGIAPAVPCSYHDNIGRNACMSNGEIEFNTNHNKNYKDSTSADEVSIINEVHSNSPAEDQSHKEAVRTVSFTAGCTPEDSTEGPSVIPEKLEPDVYIFNEDSDCYSQAEDSYGAVRTRQLMMSEDVSVYCNEEKENQGEDENISNPESLSSNHSVEENGKCNKGCIRPRKGRWPVVAAAVGLVAVVSVRSGLGRL